MTTSSNLPLILLCILLNTLAQILLKMGMNQVGYFEFSIRNIWPVTLQTMGSLPVVGGLSCYILSVVLWLMTLSRMDVSLAYPLLSLGYVLTAMAGYLFFNENLSMMRIAGIVVIITGVYLVSRS